MLRLAFVAIALLLCSNAGYTSERSLPLRQLADIRLPGNPTRLDYQSFDARRHVLFIAHLGDSEVVAVDTLARNVIGRIPDVSDVHGVLAVPELNTVYASATGANEVVAIDEQTLRVTSRTEGGVYPDGIAFDPVTRHLFVSDEHGNTDTVIDTRTNRRIATIALGGEAGNTQYDPVSRHMFVNVQTLGQLVEIDPRTNAILKRTTIAGCDGNHGLLIDEQARRAFVACEDNATLVWLDMRTMRVVKSWNVGETPDVLALDPAMNRLYVAAESGTLSIFDAGGDVRPLAQGFLAPAAHTVAVDPTEHLVYFPLQDVGGAPVLRIMKAQ